MFDTTMPDGPQLWAAVSADRASCNGYQLEERLRARERMTAWLDSESLLDVEALAHTPPGPDDCSPRRTSLRDPHVGDVVAATLSWTRYTAETFVGLAQSLTELPGTFAALRAGRIDLPKAKVLAAGVAVLADPLDRQKVENAVLGRAETKTTGWLRAEVAAQVLRIDPDAAKQRHDERVRDRGVDFYPDEDSTATVRVFGLPVDEVAEAEAFLRSIVDTQKARGDERSRPQLRADLASALLRGKAKIDDCDRDHAETADLTDTDTDPVNVEDIEDVGSDKGAPGPSSGGGDVGGDVSGEGLPGPIEDIEETDSAAPEPAARVVRRRNGSKLVLTAPIPTLLGLATRPAALGGYGPVLTDIAQQLIAKLAGDPDATICWAATDPATGHTVHTGRSNTRYLRGLLDEHVKIRDGTCRFYNCRHPASVCRADHTVDHADGGPTCSCNAGPLCAHHDTVKQAGAWKMSQPEPGRFSWTDPHGREYTVEPQQLTDAIAADPDPAPF